jgi:hypothetical protein
MLRGKTPAQVQAIKQRLKQQMMGKFRGNSKAMQELTQHFEQRFVMLAGNNPAMSNQGMSKPGMRALPAIQKPLLQR